MVLDTCKIAISFLFTFLYYTIIKKSDHATECMEPFYPFKQCMDDNGMISTSTDDLDDLNDE